MRSKRSKAGRKSKAGRALVVFIMVMTIGLLSTIYHVKGQMEDVVLTDIFYPGITVEGISLDGMTLTEAEKAVLDKISGYYSEYGILLRYKDKTWHFDHKDLKLTSDYMDVLQDAYAIGRSGSLLKRYDTVKNLAENPVSLDVTVTFTTEEIYRKLVAIAAEIDVEPVDATITFHPDRAEKFTITDEKSGIKLDVDKLAADIDIALDNGRFVEIELKPDVVNPKVYAEELRPQTEKIASFYTIVTGSEARIHNVFLAASNYNGLVVNPGEVISFNGLVGERTYARGYRAAPVIMPDKSLKDDLGGGICQTSSTIYNAAVRAGLKIEERWHHSFPSTYVDIGHDATVNWPNVDLKFSNNRETPVYFHTYRDGNRLYVEIYGSKAGSDFDEIRLESDIYARYDAPKANIIKDVNQKYVTYTDQTYTAVKSRPGYKVKTYRVFYKDGVEVKREQISNDYYRPITGTVYVGVKERPRVTIPAAPGLPAQASLY
jgi:vancomycin resistance protein YoaR